MLFQNAGRPSWGIMVSKFAALAVPSRARNDELVWHCLAPDAKEKLGAEGILVGTRDSLKVDEPDKVLRRRPGGHPAMSSPRHMSGGDFYIANRMPPPADPEILPQGLGISARFQRSHHSMVNVPSNFKTKGSQM